MHGLRHSTNSSIPAPPHTPADVSHSQLSTVWCEVPLKLHASAPNISATDPRAAVFALDCLRLHFLFTEWANAFVIRMSREDRAATVFAYSGPSFDFFFAEWATLFLPWSCLYLVCLVDRARRNDNQRHP